MLSVKYYLISPQQAYNILLALLTIDVTHPSDMNFHLNYSAVMKCQNNFKFKVRNYNTFALKMYTKFIEFTI